MEGVPNEIILEVAQRLDTKSLLNLMLTNKTIHKLIKDHQQSVLMNFMLRFITPPPDVALSSEVFLRRPIEKNTFAMAAEMERREAHAEDVLTSDYLKGAIPDDFRALEPQKKKVFYALMKKAILRCDQVADVAANAPCRPLEEQWYRQMKGQYFLPHDIPIGFRMKDPCSNLGARPSQREFLRTLPKEDIAAMCYLMLMMSRAFYYNNTALAEGDTNFPEHQVVFKECVLRHGTWFAWGQMCGDDSWKNMSRNMQRIGWTELISFELGDQETPASLHSTLSELFTEYYVPDLVDDDLADRKLVPFIPQVVLGLINGGQEEQPTGEAIEEATQQAADEAAEYTAEEAMGEVVEKVVQGLIEAAVEGATGEDQD
ncbi:hypothetical protein F4805DRAFT_391514 [Annulohypoxylon moriforme]|nr:hypothetical protein F4805DRAFT_391514 [Annulohypoxylon moriforme]